MTAARESIGRPDDHVIVLFGATGDLARRKLLPGLFHLAAANLLPRHYRIIGSGRGHNALSDADFRRHAREAVEEFGRTKPAGDAWKTFEDALSFGTADQDDASPLIEAVRSAESQLGGDARRLFHLAVPPVAFGSLVNMLGSTGLAGRSRVIVEKPFGNDLPSARALNKAIHAVFEESQVFRIDHFLGKESVENVMALRFANGLLEPIWNRDHVSYVQIDVPETLTIEGRAAFYEETGAFRDMVVTHLFQVLGVLAMEPPTSLGAKVLRDEKAKVFDAMHPIDPQDVVRGQYEGYRAEKGMASDSETETFVALRAEVDNWRWAGVPFYLRTGKALGEKRTEVAIKFKQAPFAMFRPTPVDHLSQNYLVIGIEPTEGISLQFNTK